jgi:Kdo2-lipid IVA lauroyltransferase/acyltransferase
VKHPSPTFRPSHFLHPRYWLTWLGLSFLWLLVQLPYPLLLKVGNALGMLLYRLVRRRRHIAETNIRLAFPALNAQQQKTLVKDHFRANGMAMLEIGLSWWGSEKRLRRLVQIDGLEHLQHALAQGHGAIMLGGHFTCLIIAGRMLALEIPFNIVVKKSHSDMFEALMHHYRSRQYQGLINSLDMRSMLRTLKNNRVLWYAPDQDFGSRAAVFAPFMGIATACLNSTSRMAKISRAPVIFIDFERRPGTQGYYLKLHPALENFPSGDDAKDAGRINELIEQHVHAVPEQYFWVHRRFKTRPPGEPGLYDWADNQHSTPDDKTAP